MSFLKWLLVFLPVNCLLEHYHHDEMQAFMTWPCFGLSQTKKWDIGSICVLREPDLISSLWIVRGTSLRESASLRYVLLCCFPLPVSKSSFSCVANNICQNDFYVLLKGVWKVTQLIIYLIDNRIVTIEKNLVLV